MKSPAQQLDESYLSLLRVCQVKQAGSSLPPVLVCLSDVILLSVTSDLSWGAGGHKLPRDAPPVTLQSQPVSPGRVEKSTYRNLGFRHVPCPAFQALAKTVDARPRSKKGQLHSTLQFFSATPRFRRKACGIVELLNAHPFSDPWNLAAAESHLQTPKAFPS